MTQLERQLEQYCDFVDELHGPTADLDLSYMPESVVVTRQRRNGVWAALGAAAVIVVTIGGAAVLSIDRSEPSVTVTTPVVATTPSTLSQVESPLVNELPEPSAAPVPPGATSQAPGTPLDRSPVIMALGEDHTVTWMQLVPATIDKPFRVYELPDGSYLAAPISRTAAVPFELHSSNGRNWTLHSFPDSLFSPDSIRWIEGDWAATSPIDERWEEDTSTSDLQTRVSTDDHPLRDSLWHFEQGEWQRVDLPAGIEWFNPPVVSGNTSVVAGVGRTQIVLVRSDSATDPTVTGMPWEMAPLPFLNHDAVDILTAPDNSFVAFVKNREKRGSEDVHVLSPPVTILTSTDGLTWTPQGEADFVWDSATNLDFVDQGDSLLASVSEWEGSPGGPRSERWTSTDGVSWIPAGPSDIGWDTTETSHGYIMRTQPLVLSTDGGTTWAEIPEHPDDPEAEWIGYYDAGFAGDLIWQNGDDGTWVAYID